MGRARERQRVWVSLVAVLPLVALTAAGPPRFHGILMLGCNLGMLVALYVWDSAVLASTLRAAVRQRRGLPPGRTGIDYGIGGDVWWRTVRAGEPYRAQDRRELVARGNPGMAAWALGWSLFRRTAIIGAFAVLTGLLMLEVCCPDGRRDSSFARSAARSIRSAAFIHLGAHPGECPSVGRLMGEGILDRAFSGRDPWGSPWELHCDGDEVHVTSLGPDRWVGTSDDIVIPPPDVQ